MGKESCANTEVWKNRAVGTYSGANVDLWEHRAMGIYRY